MINPLDLIHVDGQKTFVTSLDVSNRFQRQHKDVLRAIENMDCTMEYRRRNFAPTVYQRPNPSGGNSIPTPMYHITRDGFVFLCMGFKGPQAALWKERYIEAFNLMEAKLQATSVGADKHMQQMASSMDKMAQSVSKLAEGIDTVLQQNNRTGRYISLLEMNQQGHVKVTEEIRAEVFNLYAQAMPQASIARFLRLGKATVNQLIHGRYNTSQLRHKESFDAEMERRTGDVITQKIAEEKQNLQ